MTALIGVIGALLGVILGARLGHQLSTERDRVREREQAAAVATALLIELQDLEYNLTRLYETNDATRWRALVPHPMFDQVTEMLPRFGADTVRQVMQFRGLLKDVNTRLEGLLDSKEPNASSEKQLWSVKTKVYFALARIERVKVLLVREGGELPISDPVDKLIYPQLPGLPEPSFGLLPEGSPLRDQSPAIEREFD